MQLKDSIDKTKFLLQKTLQNLKSIFFGSYQKLSKQASFKAFTNCGLKNHHAAEKYYADFCNQWESDLERVMEMKKNGVIESKQVVKEDEKSEFDEISMKILKSPVKKKEELVIKDEKCKKTSSARKVEEQFSKKKNEGNFALAKKMKELEMMDVSDVDHVLDVEEAIHYYNRLKSPVYLDIVDQFFTDIYREISVPQASASITNSKRRLGSIRL